MRTSSSLARAFVLAVFAAFALVAGLPIVQPMSALASIIAATGSSADDINTANSPSTDTSGATFLALGCSWYPGVTSNATPSDNKTNTWVGLTAVEDAGSGSKIRWWYVNSATPTVGAGHVFTCSAVGGAPAMAFLAATGLSATPFGQENGTSSTSATSLAHGGGFTPAENNELLLSGLSASANSDTPAINGGFTAFWTTIASAGSVEGGGFAYLIQTTAAAANPTWSWTTAGYASTSLVSFKIAVASGPLPGSLGLMGVGR